MGEFSSEAAEKALNLCFEYSEESNIEDVLDEAKKAHDFLIGESNHFKDAKENIIPIERKEEEEDVSLIEQRIENIIKAQKSSLLISGSPLKRLRIYEALYGKLDPKFDYLLYDVTTGRY